MRILSFLLLVLLAAACDGNGDGGGQVQPDAGARPPTTTMFELADGTSVTAGPRVGCGDRFCERSPEGPGAEIARVLHVDELGRADGDGSPARPYPTLDQAFAESAGESVEIRLAAGDYACPPPGEGTRIIIGNDTTRTRLVAGGRDWCVDLHDAPWLELANLTVAGVTKGVRAQGVQRVRFRNVRVEGAAVEEGAGIGVLLSGVNTAELVDSEIRGIHGRHLVVADSGAAIMRTVIGPGEGPGILAGTLEPADAAGTCADAVSPVCPYHSLVQLESSLVHGLVSRGIESNQGVVQIRRAWIGEILPRDPAGSASGINLTQSLVTLSDQSVLARVEGVGLTAYSCRGALADIAITGNTGGGVNIDRLPTAGGAEPLRRFRFDPATSPPGAAFYPGSSVPSPAEWSVAPEVFGGADPWPGTEAFPGGAWFGDDPRLPTALQPETPEAARSEEVHLHRWARLRFEGGQVLDNREFGIRVTGHAAYIEGVEIRGTQGDRSVGLLLVQRLDNPVENAGSSVVALSQVADVVVAQNEGHGVYLARTVLVVDDVDSASPMYQLEPKLQIRGGRIRENAGPGLQVFEGAAALSEMAIVRNGGVGIGIAGAFVRAHNNEIRDTVLTTLAGENDTKVQAGDGILIRGTESWPHYTTDGIDLSDNVVTGSARAGILIVSDENLVARGRIARGEMGRISDNGRWDVAGIGNLDELELTDIEIESVTRDMAPPPLIIGPGVDPPPYDD